MRQILSFLCSIWAILLKLGGVVAFSRHTEAPFF